MGGPSKSSGQKSDSSGSVQIEDREILYVQSKQTSGVIPISDGGSAHGKEVVEAGGAKPRDGYYRCLKVGHIRDVLNTCSAYIVVGSRLMFQNSALILRASPVA